MLDPFENPAAFTPFMSDYVDIKSTDHEATVCAAVLLNARDTAEVNQHVGDCYSIVFRATQWPEDVPLNKGSVATFDNLRAYVYRVQKIGGFFHICASSNVQAAR